MQMCIDLNKHIHLEICVKNVEEVTFTFGKIGLNDVTLDQ
jgi:hypothetical protein